MVSNEYVYQLLMILIAIITVIGIILVLIVHQMYQQRKRIAKMEQLLVKLLQKRQGKKTSQNKPK